MYHHYYHHHHHHLSLSLFPPPPPPPPLSLLLIAFIWRYSLLFSRLCVFVVCYSEGWFGEGGGGGVPACVCFRKVRPALRNSVPFTESTVTTPHWNIITASLAFGLFFPSGVSARHGHGPDDAVPALPGHDREPEAAAAAQRDDVGGGRGRRVGLGAGRQRVWRRGGGLGRLGNRRSVTQFCAALLLLSGTLCFLKPHSVNQCMFYFIKTRPEEPSV